MTVKNVLPLIVLLFTINVGVSQTVIRVNQLGYLPHATKVAVLLSKEENFSVQSFTLHDAITTKSCGSRRRQLPAVNTPAFTKVTA